MPASLVGDHEELITSIRESLGDRFATSGVAGEQVPFDAVLSMASTAAPRLA